MKRKEKQRIKGRLAGCLLALGLALPVRAEEARAAGSSEALMLRATTAEKAHRGAEAACAYERLLRSDASYESVVAPRLVDLYTASGKPAEALSWAVRVARRHPDPNAYLACVHARLGQWKESELILRKALASEKAPEKRAALLWQLADAQEQLGDADAALATLLGACEAAPNKHLQRTTSQRLDALRLRRAAAQSQKPAAPGRLKAEDTP